MQERNQLFKSLIYGLFITLFFGLLQFCDDEETLAPYSDSPDVEEIIIEQESFYPKFTWKGGYVSAFGVNRGADARLDSTLQWLVQIDGDNMHYPVKYGNLPPGATDLTEQYGGQFKAFIEDSTYTYWVIKNEVWETVRGNASKYIFVWDLVEEETLISGDTLFIDPQYHTQKTCWIDVYTNVNMGSIKCRGGLATIYLAETDTSNNPIISWKIIDKNVSDTLVSALGICEGPTYDEGHVVWEVWSIDSSGSVNIYGKNNVVGQPVIMGQDFAGTREFTAYPTKGLSRNKDYMFWIANAEWDGLGHSRATPYHAYITFKTW